jgi:hypothetical protein
MKCKTGWCIYEIYFVNDALVPNSGLLTFLTSTSGSIRNWGLFIVGSLACWQAFFLAHLAPWRWMEATVLDRCALTLPSEDAGDEGAHLAGEL